MLRPPNGKNAIKRVILRINPKLSTEPYENTKIFDRL
jgi:hypothetical protein